MKKIVIVFLTIFLLASVSVYANSLPSDTEETLEKANSLMESNDEEELLAAMILFNMVYPNVENKEKVEEKFVALKNKTGYKNIAWGIDRENNVMIEVKKMNQNKINEFNLSSYNPHTLVILNNSDKDIELNVFMTKINAITENNQQVKALTIVDITSIDISLDNMTTIQNKLPANQTIYSGAEQEFWLLFKESFTPKRIIVDGIIIKESYDQVRVDAYFIRE